MKHQKLIYSVIVTVFIMLSGCGGGGGSSSTSDSVSTNFPYLLSKPQVSYVQSATVANAYDVTITLEADGPAGIFSAGLWLLSKDDDTVFTHLDLENTGGTTWTATTNLYLPLPTGNYYVDNIILEDGDSFGGGIVKAGWYFTGFISSNYYDIDQRETNWTTLEMLNYNYGQSGMTVVNFTLP